MKVFLSMLGAVLVMGVITFFTIKTAVDKAQTEIKAEFRDLKSHINSRVYRIDIDGNKFKKVKTLSLYFQPVSTELDTISEILYTTGEDTVYVYIR